MDAETSLAADISAVESEVSAGKSKVVSIVTKLRGYVTTSVLIAFAAGFALGALSSVL